jgi:hypothetical protein
MVGEPLPAICQQLPELGSAMYPAAQFWPGEAGTGGTACDGAEANNAAAATLSRTVDTLSPWVISMHLSSVAVELA